MGLSTNAYLIIAAIAIAGLALLLWSSQKKPNRGKPTQSSKRSKQPPSTPAKKNPFRATSIAAGTNACAAAQALAGKRFLVADDNIPQLPLSDCDMASCSCKYEHHQDRREEGVLRRAPSSLRTELHSHTEHVERRRKRGRRSTDWE
ncbi:MAG: hypothetical protein R3E64_15450 [Halioglobus sp.]